MKLTIEQAFQQAIDAHQSGKLQDAEVLYRAILQVQPRHPDANHNLGVLAISVNQSGAALPFFKAALEANPNQAQFWVSYIDTLIKEKQFDIATSVLHQGKKLGLAGKNVDALAQQLTQQALAPTQAEINKLLKIYHKGDHLTAKKLAKLITQRFPNHQLGWKVLGEVLKQTGEISGSLAAKQKVVELAPNDEKAHYDLGIVLQMLGKLEEAGANYSKAIVLKPDYAEAHYSLSVTLQLLGRLEDAETSYRNVIALKPNLAQAHYNLGITLHDLGKLDDAEASFKNALALRPDLTEAHYNLGITLHELGKLEDAEISHRKVIALKPSYAEAYCNLGNTLQKLGRPEDAEASYRQAIALKPNYAEAHCNLGNTLQKFGRPEDAEASYRQAIALKPNYAEAHNNLGVILLYMGRLVEAEAHYRKALQINPSFASAHLNLHSLLLNPSDMTHSITCVEAAVKLEPENANFRFFLGMLLDYSGNHAAAASHFDFVERNVNPYRPNLYRARLDAWQHLKSSSNTLPQITGSNIQTFRLGLDVAICDGLILEFGVRFGTSIRQIATLVDQEIHGFDSFEGIPEQWHHEPKGSYSTKGAIPNVPGNVVLHAGWFEDTLPKFLKSHSGAVRFMNIDCDIYSSTKTVLDFLAERIIQGTVIVFDEYIGNEFWREDEFKAFQEAVTKYNWRYEYISFSFFTKQVVVRIVET